MTKSSLKSKIDKILTKLLELPPEFKKSHQKGLIYIFQTLSEWKDGIELPVPPSQNITPQSQSITKKASFSSLKTRSLPHEENYISNLSKKEVLEELRQEMIKDLKDVKNNLTKGNRMIHQKY